MSEVIRRPKIHQSVDDLVDVWLFHDKGDRRQVMTILSFVFYAFSPSTERVVYSPDKGNMSTGEIRAYGGKGRFVWYTVCPGSGEYVDSMVAGLFSEMEKLNKLAVI